MSKSVASARILRRHILAEIFGTLILLFPTASLVVPRGGFLLLRLILATPTLPGLRRIADVVSIDARMLALFAAFAYPVVSNESQAPSVPH